jgi:hypothetical protein
MVGSARCVGCFACHIEDFALHTVRQACAGFVEVCTLIATYTRSLSTPGFSQLLIRESFGELTIGLGEDFLGDGIALRRVQLDRRFRLKLSCHIEFRIDTISECSKDVLAH